MTVDAQILSALRAAPCGVSGSELSRQLGMTRAGVWAHIEALRALGYDIEASPHLGYRLLGAPDALHADDLSARLGKVRVVGREIHVFQETTSTNDVAARLARGGALEGAVVFAESQTKGRGRMGRAWVSPAGKGLWFPGNRIVEENWSSPKPGNHRTPGHVFAFMSVTVVACQLGPNW